MKTKLSYLLIIFISMFIYSGEVGAENISKGTCTYNVGNVSLVVTQDGDNNISTTISGNDNTNVFKGATFDKSKSTIEKKVFFSSGNFSCPKVYACEFEDTMNANADGTVPLRWSLESDSNVKCIDKKSYSGKMTATTTCSYEKKLVDGYTCVVEVTAGAGNTISTKKRKCNNVTLNLKAEYYYDNGTFTCATATWGQETLYEGVIVYTLANSKEDLPGNGFEVIPDEPSEPIIDDGIEDKNPNGKEEQIVTDGETIKIVKRIYDIIKVLIPVLIVILSTVDFLKVILYDDEKNYKAAFDKLVKRLIIGVIFFLIPILVSFVIKYSGLDIEQSYLEIFK